MTTFKVESTNDLTLDATSLSESRSLYVQDKDGTIALQEDFEVCVLAFFGIAELKKTGTGAFVFDESPILDSPTLNTPSIVGGADITEGPLHLSGGGTYIALDGAGEPEDAITIQNDNDSLRFCRQGGGGSGVTYGCVDMPVSELPDATYRSGQRAVVRDATSTDFHSVVVGGGNNYVPVFSAGGVWRIG